MSHIDMAEGLWEGEKGICFFVHRSIAYWVIDYRYNICLDAEIEYRAYLDKGRISEDQYAQACKEFRNGILRLDEKNFLDYLSSVNGGYCAEDMRSMFCASDMAPSKDDELHERVETHLLVGTGLHKDDSIAIGHLVSRLPNFYINFDRKIFAHMEYGRSHEDLAYDDWSASYMDFCHLIPDENRYWAIGRDYWKYRYIYN